MFKKIFRIARRTIELPIAVVKDVGTLGMKKALDGNTFTEDKLDEIEEALEA